MRALAEDEKIAWGSYPVLSMRITEESRQESVCVVTRAMLDAFKHWISPQAKRLLIEERRVAMIEVAHGETSSNPIKDQRIEELKSFFDRFDSNIRSVHGSEIIHLMTDHVCSVSSPLVIKWRGRAGGLASD